MSIRLNCRACRTAFVISDDLVGRRVTCPKCGAEQTAPATALHVPSAVEAPEAQVFVPNEPPKRKGWFRTLAAGMLILLAVAAVVVAVFWPTLRRWWHPTPPDPIEVAATTYLQALADGHFEAAHRLGTVDEPPAIRSFRDVRRLPERDRTIQGSFAPIAALHARIDEKFEYDPAIGRFKLRDPLGPAAETLDTLHEAKAKAEQDEIYKKMASGDPNDLFDAAEGLGGALARMAEGALAPQKLVPTYKQLLADAKPPLPPAEEELALDFADHRASWDALLKRPFPTLKADGPFRLERAEVEAKVRDQLASLGDPPTTLRLTLVRFRLEGIDTGWKITSTRRLSAMPGPPTVQEPASPSHSEPGPSSPQQRSPGEPPQGR